MADFSQWIGKQCNLLSKQGIRYTGVLVNVDHTVAKIQVSNVRSFGTETRSTPVFIPAIEQPFPLIEFMANDLTDLQFDTPAPAMPQPPYTPSAQSVTPGTSVPVAPPTPPSPSAKASQSVPPPQPSNQFTSFTSFSAERAPPPVNVQPVRAQQPTSTVQLGRAMGGMNISNGHSEAIRGRGAHRGERGRGRGYGRPYTAPIPAAASIPTTDFDFQSNNQRFDKKTTPQEHPALQSKPAEYISFTDGAENRTNGHTESAEPKKDEFYNPSKSFFDNLSSDANKTKPERPASAPAERARARGRGRGRSRRDEERDRNVETFGEAGGVGLLGPGQYVGGFGGFRGRKRRGAPRGAGPGGPGGGGRGRGIPRALVADA